MTFSSKWSWEYDEILKDCQLYFTNKEINESIESEHQNIKNISIHIILKGNFIISLNLLLMKIFSNSNWDKRNIDWLSTIYIVKRGRPTQIVYLLCQKRAFIFDFNMWHFTWRPWAKLYSELSSITPWFFP